MFNIHLVQEFMFGGETLWEKRDIKGGQVPAPTHTHACAQATHGTLTWLHPRQKNTCFPVEVSTQQL